MTDIEINKDTFEIVIDESGDFALTNKAGRQNNLMFYVTRRCDLLNPTIGIGMNSSFNGSIDTKINLLNKWTHQVLNDGAKSASWDKDQKNNVVLKSNYVD